MPKYRVPATGRVIERSEDYAAQFPHWEQVADDTKVDKICIPCGDSPAPSLDGEWDLPVQPDPEPAEDDEPSGEDKEIN